MAPSDRTRGKLEIYETEIYEKSFKLEENICTVRVNEHCPRLPRLVMELSSWERMTQTTDWYLTLL